MEKFEWYGLKQRDIVTYNNFLINDTKKIVAI